jgi:type VI secretion system secreted protein VgrG
MPGSALSITQKDRLMSLDTPLGQDVLLPESFVGSESISGLFSYELDLLADLENKKDQSVKFDALIGKGATLKLETKNGRRYFHGMIRRFVEGYQSERFVHYRMELVPWLWLLTLKSNLRIFQDMSCTDILKKVFDGVKSSHSELVAYRDATTASYEKWDYCVQYRETDFNFVSRLMEQEGIFYFFEHENGKHTLVFADANSAFRPCPGQSKFRFGPGIGMGDREDFVSHLQKQEELRPGKYTLRDYHFELPSKTLEKSEPTVIKQGNNSSLEMYDFPGDYSQRFNKPGERLGSVEQVGEKLARHRMFEEEVSQSVLNGNAYSRNFVPGFTFELQGHRSGIDGKYVFTSVHHSAKQSPSYFSDESHEIPYTNTFVCTPYAATFHPRRVTPKPVVQGPHTAVVTVKSQEESWLDKYGRVRVQFHWDREGKRDENSTCWVRVAQPWAGNTWGAHFWPRIGQEVIVEFLEGDPDRPIITGSVYNSSQMPPYTLPDNYTRSGVKTRSSKNGSSSNYNELRFEDKKGDEQIFMNAEKDMDLRVEHDSREFVGNDRSLIVQNDQKEKVGGEQDIQIAKDQNESVGGDASLNVTGNQNVQVGQTMSLQVGQNLQEKSGQNYAHEAGMEIHLKAGMNVVIEAGLELTIMASGGFINIGPAGIAISGTLVLINSGGAAGSGSPSSPTSPKSPKDPDTADDGSKGGKM